MSFEVAPEIAPTEMWGSEGGWAACEACSKLIEKGNFDGLADRSMARNRVATMLQGFTRAERRIVKEEQLRLMRRFAQARRGPRRVLAT